MHIRYVSLYIFPEEYGRAYGSSFELHARYLCNYLRRRILGLRFKTKGFGAILIRGCRTANDPAYISSNRNIIVPLPFDQARYNSLKPGELHEFFISMLVEGLHKVARHHNIPLTEILGFVEEFRKGGYKNEWVHQSKLLRGTGLRASLLCAMDSERFTLRLKLERKGAPVFDQQILQDLPSETCFAHKFKDIVLKGRKVIVTQMFAELPGKQPLFTLDLNDLEKADAPGK
ncbi:MAG: hypothetical protein IPP14_08280 [Planctomycetes bacterium]|nr:hypothetical protein [Planctomycetota bacterium]